MESKEFLDVQETRKFLKGYRDLSDIEDEIIEKEDEAIKASELRALNSKKKKEYGIPDIPKDLLQKMPKKIPGNWLTKKEASHLNYKRRESP